MSPPERCYFVVKLEKIHEHLVCLKVLQVCRICAQRAVFYDMAQCGLLYDKSLQLIPNVEFKHRAKRKFSPTYIRIHSKQMNRC